MTNLNRGTKLFPILIVGFGQTLYSRRKSQICLKQLN